MSKMSEYVELAREVGVFKDIELDILEGTLETLSEQRTRANTLIEVRDGLTLAGFALYAPIPLTEHSFEVSWFVVDQRLLKHGIAQMLLKELKEKILSSNTDAVLRIDTTTRRLSCYPDHFLEDSDFLLIGKIQNFYESENDFLMYSSYIFKKKKELDDGI